MSVRCEVAVLGLAGGRFVLGAGTRHGSRQESGGVSTVVDPSLLEKLRRIRAMKTSPFPAEAETAGRMLAEQLEKNGLTEDDLDGVTRSPFGEGFSGFWDDIFSRWETRNGRHRSSWTFDESEPPHPQRPKSERSRKQTTEHGYEAWGNFPSTFYRVETNLSVAYVRYMALGRKLADADLSFDDWHLAEYLARDCGPSRSAFLKDMCGAVSSYGTLTRSQARGFLNIVLYMVRSLRDSMLPPDGRSCLICKGFLDDDESIRRTIHIFCYRKALNIQ